MIKTQTYKLYNNPKYLKKYEKWMGVSRYVYNTALEVWKESYKKGVSVNYQVLSRQLTEAKKEHSFIREVNAQSLQAVLERLQKAYDKYFSELKKGNITKGKVQYIEKKLKNGGKINYNKLQDFGKPKWAKKGEFQTIVFKQNNSGSMKETQKGFKLPSFGEVKVFNKNYKINGKIKQAKLTLKADGLYLNVIIETEPKVRENQSDEPIGIDMGIKYFLSTSDGQQIDNPRFLNKALPKLKEAQRKLSNMRVEGRRKQSNNYYKQQKAVSRLHKKVADCRLDFLHKVSTELANNYKMIIREDLKVSEMIKDTNYSQHISDVAWSLFFELLESKTQVETVNPAYTSQTCSKCGHTHKNNRPTQSIFECISCGHEENADLNAAKNILNKFN